MPISFNKLSIFDVKTLLKTPKTLIFPVLLESQGKEVQHLKSRTLV
jgi:hypothetical protein